MKRSTSILSVAFVSMFVPGASGNTDPALSAKARDLLARTPGLQANSENGAIRSLYGRPITTGSNPFESAERFRLQEAEVFGVLPQDLRPESFLPDGRHAQQLMYDQTTGTYKFTLVYFRQYSGGIPVFRSDMRLLIRNEEGFPLVMAKNYLRPLGDFDPAAIGGRSPDKGLAAAKAAVAALTQFTQPELVVWAGVDHQTVAPAVGYKFIGDSGTRTGNVVEKWLFITDADTGNILYQENQLIDTDVAGNVSGMASQGPGADICALEELSPLPYARTNINATQVFADANGDFVIPNAGTTTVTVTSPIRGERFVVNNLAGANTVLNQNVLPPGPADFVHNALNASEFRRGEVNAYVSANIVRDFTLVQNPNYPVVAGQTEMGMTVNEGATGFCPGNAQYQGDNLRFCAAGGSSPNTAWSSVVYHEYGHHLVAVGGSGQGAYGEGLGDVLSTLILDDNRLGVGFFGNCTTWLRDADNTLQYPCSGEIHFCGQLLSGSVWETRQALIATHPTDYLDILSSLAVNAILLHNGSGISPQITIDFLTLNDDDGNIQNGTPQYDEICAGFGAHNMTCPPLAPIIFEYPNSLPETVIPNAPTTILVNVTALQDTPVPGTGQVSYRIGNGLFFFDAMTELAPNQYEATLPAADCGQTIEYFFRAQSVGGGTVTDPPNAGPGNSFATLATAGLDVLADFDFEAAGGWTVSGSVTDGPWDRGVPISGCTRGNPPTDFDGSGSCWLTDNSDNGGNCNSDVDGGTTILTSPVFDLSLADNPRVNYARWFSNTEGDSPEADIFEVEVSDNGGATWSALETVGPSGAEVDGGWFDKSFLISDFVALTNQVRFRFKASDLGAGSVVEAGLDAFSIVDINCIPLNTPPTVLAQPLDDTVCENAPAQFDVVVGGAGPFSYQWFVDGSAIAGATSASLVIPNALGADEGAYHAEITNAFGTTVSNSALLDVILTVECDDTNACTVDSCAAAICINTDTTPADQCCDPIDATLTAIDDVNACTTDACLPNGSVTHTDNFDPATQCCNTLDGAVETISDQNACTDDTCNPDGSVSNVDNFDVATQCCDPLFGGVVPIDDADDCTSDLCDPGTGIVSYSVATPQAADLGSRSVSAAPAACADQVALLVTSDDHPCLSLYVAADGTLSITPMFQTPAAWGSVVLRAEEIVPSSSYRIQSETAGGVLSGAAQVTTWAWGDVNNDTVANFTDIFFIVEVFQGNLTHATVEATDIEPCVPNQTVNLADVQRAVGAFQGQTHADSGCPVPCP